MNTYWVILIVALYVQSVYSSHYQGPTALPEVLHNGYLADTHEVAAAKSAHLATLSLQSQGQSYGHHGNSHYNQQGHQGNLKYHGPFAIPHVLHDGHIADTQEVAAAKAEHFAAVAKAHAHGGYSHGGDYSGQYASGYEHYSGASGVHTTYQGPIAIPYVLHNGHIADTHEVAAAKAEHFAAVAKARAHAGQNHANDYASGASGAYNGYGTHTSYHGPLANPIVLPSGYLANTYEVAAAKQEHLLAVDSSRSGQYTTL